VPDGAVGRDVDDLPSLGEQHGEDAIWSGRSADQSLDQVTVRLEQVRHRLRLLLCAGEREEARRQNGGRAADHERSRSRTG
jgi:hypothetical protein